MRTIRLLKGSEEKKIRAQGSELIEKGQFGELCDGIDFCHRLEVTEGV
jgi:hypothetical protein